MKKIMILLGVVLLASRVDGQELNTLPNGVPDTGTCVIATRDSAGIHTTEKIRVALLGGGGNDSVGYSLGGGNPLSIVTLDGNGNWYTPIYTTYHVYTGIHNHPDTVFSRAQYCIMDASGDTVYIGPSGVTIGSNGLPYSIGDNNGYNAGTRVGIDALQDSIGLETTTVEMPYATSLNAFNCDAIFNQVAAFQGIYLFQGSLPSVASSQTLGIYWTYNVTTIYSLQTMGFGGSGSYGGFWFQNYDGKIGRFVMPAWMSNNCSWTAENHSYTFGDSVAITDSAAALRAAMVGGGGNIITNDTSGVTGAGVVFMYNDILSANNTTVVLHGYLDASVVSGVTLTYIVSYTDVFSATQTITLIGGVSGAADDNGETTFKAKGGTAIGVYVSKPTGTATYVCGVVMNWH